jgi:multiple sugar transport system permease protein
MSGIEGSELSWTQVRARRADWRRPSRLHRLAHSDHFWGWLFVVPTVIGLVCFSAGPILAAFAISLTEWNIVDSPRWVGTANYVAIFRDDPLFWKAVRNTIVYTVGVIPLQMAVSLLVALVLNRRLRFLPLFRTLYFVPVVCSTVSIAFVWRALFDYRLGALNWLLDVGGIDPVPWLIKPSTAMLAVVLMSAWQGLGYALVLWLAGLQSIPETYCEAAKIDGAGPLSLLRNITWPLLTPTTFFILVISAINSFQVFEQTFVLTAGGPQRATYTLVYAIYDEGFQKFAMGRASAIGYVLFIAIMVLTLGQLWLQRRWVHYDL